MDYIHTEPHPNAGKFFRVNIDGGKVFAGYDRMIHGQVLELLDWADRIEQNRELTPRQIEVALQFYAHRCLPDLEPDGHIFIGAFDLSDLVYGTLETQYSEWSHKHIVVLHNSELIDPEVWRKGGTKPGKEP